MLSESARMNSAAEARFRIQAASSYSRIIKVIALDTSSETVVRRLAGGDWEHTTFLTAAALSAVPPVNGEFSAMGWLSDLAGRPRNLTDEVDEAAIASRLYAPSHPDPDLLIRTGGELRVSNFLLWEAAYAELWFTPVLWPDFNREHLFEAIRDFQKRSRRFGALDDQI